MNRRDFLKLLGLGGLGAGAGFVLSEASRTKAAKLIPYLVPPEDTVPGVASWYASLCTQCSAGCGTIVKVMEGRAKKIEGNPLHPVSKGKLCARGQTSLQVLYNPDRIKTPLRRTGKRGSNKFEEISWDEGLRLISGKLNEIKQSAGENGLAVLTPSIRGHLAQVIKQFIKSYGSGRHVEYELFQNLNLIAANKITSGSASIPYYDIENTKFLLSFGADFVLSWLSPVSFGRAYGHMRQGGKGGRGRFIQIEPRMSLAAANADEWVPVKPGGEGFLAMSMAHVIVAEGYYKGDDVDGWRVLLKRFAPENVAGDVDVDEERIRNIAKEFAADRHSLAIGGENVSSYREGLSTLVAINILNYLAGNVGRKGGVILNPEIPNREENSTNKLIDIVKYAENGDIDTLIVYNTNPLFTTPPSLKVRESFEKVPFIASFSSFMDETTVMADLILPSHTALEDWGDDFAEPGQGMLVSTIMQPIVSPLYNTRGVGDIFMEVAKRVGGGGGENASWKSFADYLRESWRKIYRDNRRHGSLKDKSFDLFWEGVLSKGGWWDYNLSGEGYGSIPIRKIASYIPAKTPDFEGSEAEYPYYMILYPHSAFYDGRGANIPWLQEMPDPMTSVVWDVWVEINPATAGKMQIREGDIVTVKSPNGSIRAAVYLHAGIRPDTIAMPVGQGHSVYGRYAGSRGVNPISILPPNPDSRTAAVPLNSTRVSIRVAKRGAGGMVKMAGSDKELGRGIVKTMSPDQFEKMGKREVT